MKNIHAHTETHHQSPGYISINEYDDHVSVTVRSRGAHTAGVVELNRDQLTLLNADISTYLAATAPQVTVDVPVPPVTITTGQ